MKAYLIDPSRFTIAPVEIDRDHTLEQLYKHIGCDMVEAVYLENGDTLYVDEEGLLKRQWHFIVLDGYPQPIAGKGVLVGATPAGNSTDAKTSLEALTAKVSYMEMLVNGVVSIREAVRPKAYHLERLDRVLERLEKQGPA